MESSTMTSKQSTPFLFQLSVKVGEDSNPTNHSSQEKIVLVDARGQWYRSRPVVLGFLSSILLHTTALILVLTDVHSERKRQIADVLMLIPLGAFTFFFCLFFPALLFCSLLARRKPSPQCCSMLRAAVHFCGSFSFGMDLNLLVASWLGLLKTVAVEKYFAIALSLACWGVAAYWEEFLATWEVEEEKADIIYVW
jgi:hypothetical protein